MRLRSIYINNYRCLQNFSIDFEQSDTLLLLGRNGMGKSTVLEAIRSLHAIACGIDRVDDLFKRRDFAFGQIGTPMRFELAIDVDGTLYDYSLTVTYEYEDDAVLVSGEELKSGDTVFFSRTSDQVRFLAEDNILSPCPIGEDRFLLTLFRGQNRCGVACEKVRSCIAGWILVSPRPESVITDFLDKSGYLASDTSNFLGWFRNVMVRNVGFTDQLMEYLRNGCFARLESLSWSDPMKDRKNEMLLSVSDDAGKVWEMRFSEMSDGEKIFVLGAALMTYNAICGGTFCFWDEPDNFLAVSEVQDFVTRLRKSFGHGRGQLVITSHNIETIRTIGMDSTVVMRRSSHLEPVRIQFVGDLLKTEAEHRDYIQEILTGDIYGL